MNKPKIFVDAHCFDGGYQGSRTFIQGLYGSRAMNEQLDVYLGACDIENLREAFPMVPFRNFVRYKSRNRSMRLGIEIPGILKSGKFDYAHFQYVAPFRKYCKYIVTTHDILFKDFKQEFPWYYRVVRDAVFRRSIKRADVKSTPSVYSRERISFYYKVPYREIQLIPNGVDENLFSSDCGKGASSDFIWGKYGIRNFILCVSRIEPRKNQAFLLEAFLNMELYKQGISLIFVGEAAMDYAIFTRKMLHLPIVVKDNIKQFKRVPPSDLVHFYMASRLLVYPSKAEGFGIPPLEAAALEVPVLCSNSTAMAAYTFFKENLFNPANMPDFEVKLGTLLLHPPDSGELEKISAFIRENYSWEESRRRLLKSFG